MLVSGKGDPSSIALDDSYATSYALAAEWHGLRVGQGWSPDPEADSREAVRLAQSAVDRDSKNIRAITLLAHYKSFLFKDYDGALTLFKRALDMSPNNAWTWGLSAPTHSYIGDGHSAIERTERALRLSPRDLLAFYYHTSLCIAHYTGGAYEEAAQGGKIALSENPRFTAARAIADPILRLGDIKGRDSVRARCEELATPVGLPLNLIDRFPHQLSGGQKARVGIARAIALYPRLVILDEPTAALDVSVQAVVLNLLQDLKASMGMSYLFVSHDLNVVRLLCDRVIVMRTGRIVEQGPAERVLSDPQDAYTRELLTAIPHPPLPLH